MEDKLLKEIKNNVGYVWINRPDKKNALDADVWFGLPEVINELCLLYTSPSPRDRQKSRMPSSA